MNRPMRALPDWIAMLRAVARIALCTLLGMFTCTGTTAAVGPVFPGKTWQRVDPATAGWSADGLRAAQAEAATIGSTAVMIVHDGRVVAEWGDVRKKVWIHSMRKSVMSALYGIAVARGEVDLRRSLGDLGIDDEPPSLTAIEKTATVRDLLMARSGVYHLAAAETAQMKEVRPERGSHSPGTFWYYNNWDFNVLGAILRQANGKDTFAAVGDQIARPLQMEDFTAADGRYVKIPASRYPAYTMRFTARDLARFGWLYLNEGTWGGVQVVPAAWVAESTKPLSDAQPGIGYGYLWWAAKKDMHFQTRVGPGTYSARGHLGQYIVIDPANRLVVVHLNERADGSKIEGGGFGRLLQRIYAAMPR